MVFVKFFYLQELFSNELTVTTVIILGGIVIRNGFRRYGTPEMDEFIQEQFPVLPCIDPILRTQPRKNAAFIRRLNSSDFLNYTQAPLWSIGVFVKHKRKANSDWLWMLGRPTSNVYLLPPCGWPWWFKWLETAFCWFLRHQQLLPTLPDRRIPEQALGTPPPPRLWAARCGVSTVPWCEDRIMSTFVPLGSRWVSRGLKLLSHQCREYQLALRLSFVVLGGSLSMWTTFGYCCSPRRWGRRNWRMPRSFLMGWTCWLTNLMFSKEVERSSETHTKRAPNSFPGPVILVAETTFYQFRLGSSAGALHLSGSGYATDPVCLQCIVPISRKWVRQSWDNMEFGARGTALLPRSSMLCKQRVLSDWNPQVMSSDVSQEGVWRPGMVTSRWSNTSVGSRNEVDSNWCQVSRLGTRCCRAVVSAS